MPLYVSECAMTSFTLSPLPEIVFGAGRLAELGQKVEALAGKGGHVLVVADPALRGLGITARALDILEKTGYAADAYEGLKGEPKQSDIDAAAQLAGAKRSKVIIGLGGGSALDTAKLVASCAVSGLSASAYALCAT